jgi:hypothetical protein
LRAGEIDLNSVLRPRGSHSALRSNLDDRAIREPLMPRQRGLPPVDDDAIFKVLETSSPLEWVVEVPGARPFGMRASWRQRRFSSRHAHTNIVDANKPAIEALLAEEDCDLLTPVKDGLRLVLLIGIEPARSPEGLQGEPAVFVTHELGRRTRSMPRQRIPGASRSSEQLSPGPTSNCTTP